LTPKETEGLTRAEIVALLRDSLSISARDAQNILEGFISAISRALEDGAQVSLSRLGRFQVKPTPSRPGRNPKTGATVKVPAKIRPSFALCRDLKAAMAERLPETPEAGQPLPEAGQRGESR
jgi:integration host factor subunit alpha